MKNILNHASSIICGLLLLSAATPLHALDFGAWGKKAEITFTGYTGSETLTNFPALVVLGSGTVIGFSYDDCLAGGADLRFSDSTGLAELPYEIEQWNPAGDSLVWVRVPELVDADTSIWAYWGNPVATAPAYTTDGSTWDSNFVAVWHMNQPSSRDSTANALHATSQGTTLDAVGFVGVGQNLNGNYLSVANNALLNFTSPGLTMSGFAKPNAVGSESALIRKESQYQLGFYSNVKLRPLLATTGTTGWTANNDQDSSTSPGVWTHFAFTYRNGAGLQNYINGAAVGSAKIVTGDIKPSTTPLGLGATGTGVNKLNGSLDELRIEKIARSADWMRSVWMNMASNDVFQTYGVAMNAASGAPVVVLGGVTNITASSAWLCGNLVSTGVADTAVIAYWGPTDGGTNAANWANSAALAAPQLEGDFSIQATGLAADSSYYARVAATNAAGVAWSYYGGSFITGELTLTKTSDADEATLAPGVFTVTRPGTATNEALSVSYAQTGGTAVSGVDYAPLPGSVTIPAGAASAAIAVVPLKNYALMADTTLELSLTGAQAILGSDTNATMTIFNEGLPGGATNVWIRSGADPLASTAANWSLGHAPTNQNAIVLLGPYASAPDMTWDLTNAVASWTQTAQYGGTVTIQTKYPGQGAFTNLIVSGNVVLDGGTWTHAPNPSGNTEVNRLYVRVGGDFTLGTNAFVNVDGKGYAAGAYGPGRGVGENYDGYGASHGGWDAERLSPGPYGSIVSPTTLGSSSSARAGGGAVLLEVAGHCRIDGAVSAIGINVATSTGYNAGAGGSILLRTGTLDGSGSLNARGGRAYYGGSAGGGRIAMIVADGESFGNVRATAFGGVNGPGNYVNFEGSAGTVYQEHAGHLPGKGVLTIAAEHSAYRYAMPHWPVTEMPKASAWNPAVNLDDFSAIVITNGGNLGIVADTTMKDWTPARFVVHGAENSFITVRSTNGVAFPPAMTITNYSLHLDVPVQTAGDWTIAATGNLGHNFHGKLDLSIDGDLTVATGGTISGHRRGYLAGGPGSGSSGYTSGASHGGRGRFHSTAFKPTYGSVLAPVEWGSEHNQRGGGAIKVAVTGTLRNDGAIDANADMTYPWSGSYGSGSGGSVWLSAHTFAGSGTVSALGGNGNYGGGGGRISLIESTGSGIGGFPLDARGGNNYAAPGTFYRQGAAHAPQAGVVTVFGQATWTPGTSAAGTNTYCELPPATLAVPDELKRATLRIEGQGRVGLSADLRVGNLYLVNGSAAMPQLILNGHTLKVDSYFHPDWGDEAWVVYDGGEIVWRGGTLLTIR